MPFVAEKSLLLVAYYFKIHYQPLLIIALHIGIDDKVVDNFMALLRIYLFLLVVFVVRSVIEYVHSLARLAVPTGLSSIVNNYYSKILYVRYV